MIIVPKQVCMYIFKIVLKNQNLTSCYLSSELLCYIKKKPAWVRRFELFTKAPSYSRINLLQVNIFHPLLQKYEVLKIYIKNSKQVIIQKCITKILAWYGDLFSKNIYCNIKTRNSESPNFVVSLFYLCAGRSTV